MQVLCKKVLPFWELLGQFFFNSLFYILVYKNWFRAKVNHVKKKTATILFKRYRIKQNRMVIYWFRSPTTTESAQYVVSSEKCFFGLVICNAKTVIMFIVQSLITKLNSDKVKQYLPIRSVCTFHFQHLNCWQCCCCRSNRR